MKFFLSPQAPSLFHLGQELLGIGHDHGIFFLGHGLFIHQFPAGGNGCSSRFDKLPGILQIYSAGRDEGDMGQWALNGPDVGRASNLGDGKNFD